MTYDVIVIGGGASGVFAAGRAAERGAKSLLIERNSQLCKKMLITGKGRCNLTNSGEMRDFIISYRENGKFLYRAFREFFNHNLIDFFERYGVETKIERGGRVFPVSDNSISVVRALRRYISENAAAIKLNTRVKEVIITTVSGEKKVQGVRLDNRSIIEAGKVIIATGGLSYPQTGSTGDGYRMAKKGGHSVTSLRPGLVPLETKEKFVKDLQGLSLKNVAVTVFSNGEKLCAEFGEMLFTHFGVSGPIILELSGKICERLAENESVVISINFKPALSRAKLEKRLLREFSSLRLKSIRNVMTRLLPGSLISVFVELTGIPPDKKSNQITASEREKIIDLLTDFRLEIVRSRPIREAIITRGGVSLKEINPYTMESRLVRGLYFCGEVIDIDGVTGGFNLQAAFSTGYLAGSSAASREESMKAEV
jgi:hypothetical protein